MRLLLALVAVVTLAVPAAACPQGACKVRLRSAAREPALASVPAGIGKPDPRVAAPESQPSSELPWIWQALRDEVLAHMPRYDRPHELTVVLSPVVVASASMTVAGIGIAGRF